MTTLDARVQAVEAYVKALRTAERSAVAWASGCLAPDVALHTGKEEIVGREHVAARLALVWPLTSVYLHGSWSAPQQDGAGLLVRAEFAAFGAAPRSETLRFAFNAVGQIARIAHETVMPAPPEPTETIPDVVRGLINAALANGTPIVVAYVDADGRPRQSLRGSVQVYSEHELCLWLRPAAGGLAQAIASNPHLSLLYRDSRSRTTLIMQGQGRIEEDAALRERVYNLAPEVEQTHDRERGGQALIVALERLQGTHPRGPLRMQRAQPS